MGSPCCHWGFLGRVADLEPGIFALFGIGAAGAGLAFAIERLAW